MPVDWAPVETKDYFNIDLKLKRSEAFKDGEPAEDAEDQEEEAKKLRFPWHCEKGIIDNIRRLNIEYNENRGLKPVKNFITGPPAGGKSEYSAQISSYYNIPTIQVGHLVTKAFTMSKIEESEDELVNEIKAKIEELKD